MSARSMIPFLAAVMIVAVGGTLLALNFLGMLGNREPNTITQLVTVQVVITATPDPNQTPNVIIITATPDRTQVALPPEIVAAASTSAAVATRPTLDVAGAQALNPSIAETATALPANCLLHTIQEGDTPFGIAVQYDANPFTLLEANGLTEETATSLQIGDTLIVPLEGCPVDQLASFIGSSTNEEEPTATLAEATSETTSEPNVTPTATPSPTLTLAPTAANAQIQITRIEKIGDVTAEGIEIRNTGNTVNVTGWTLSDADGNVYTFGEQLLFSNSTVMIYTRPGQNTPFVLFWGLDKPVWSVGDVMTLRDKEGEVQATQRIESSGLPQ